MKSIGFSGNENLELWVTKADGSKKVVSIREGLKGNDTLIIG